jgi:hypothetical protein
MIAGATGTCPYKKFKSKVVRYEQRRNHLLFDHETVIGGLLESRVQIQ